MTKCRLCGNNANNQTYKVREMMLGTGDTFDYFKCSRCGCLQISGIPENMSKYYPETYYSYKTLADSSPRGIKLFFVRARDMYALNSESLLGYFLCLVKPAMLIIKEIGRAGVTMNSRILDVGCGTGGLINYMGDIGFSHIVGADPFVTNNIAYRNGVKVFKKTVHDMDGEFDLIMFNHSFEHISDPVETLNSVYRLLVADGVCMIRIPTVSSFAWEKYGVNWVNLDAPRHYYLYSIDNIQQLAANAGLYVQDISYDSDEFQFWGSEQYQKGISLYADDSYLVNPSKSIFTERQIMQFHQYSRELNKLKRGDCVAIYLKKQKHD